MRRFQPQPRRARARARTFARRPTGSPPRPGGAGLAPGAVGAAGPHGAADRLANAAEDAEPLLEARAPVGIHRGAVGLVVGRLVDEGQLRVPRCAREPRAPPPLARPAGMVLTPSVGEGGLDEGGEERMRLPRPGAQLRVELAGHEPGMVGELDDLHELLLGPEARDPEAVLFP